MRRASVANALPLGGGLGDLLSGLLDRSPGGASLRLALLSAVLAGYWFALAWAAGFPVLLPRQWTDGLPFPLNPIADLAASFLAPSVLVQEIDRKSTRLNSSHPSLSRMPSSA